MRKEETQRLTKENLKIFFNHNDSRELHPRIWHEKSEYYDLQFPVRKLKKQ